MMIVPLRDVPRRERHLLFCTKLVRSRTRRRQPRSTHLAAINRSLAAHGDGVATTWTIGPSPAQSE